MERPLAGAGSCFEGAQEETLEKGLSKASLHQFAGQWVVLSFCPFLAQAPIASTSFPSCTLYSQAAPYSISLARAGMEQQSSAALGC